MSLTPEEIEALRPDNDGIEGKPVVRRAVDINALCDQASLSPQAGSGSNGGPTREQLISACWTAIAALTRTHYTADGRAAVADSLRRMLSGSNPEPVHSAPAQSGSPTEIEALVERINGLYAAATPGPWVGDGACGYGWIDAGNRTLFRGQHRDERTDAQLAAELVNAWPQIAKALGGCQDGISTQKPNNPPAVSAVEQMREATAKVCLDAAIACRYQADVRSIEVDINRRAACHLEIARAAILNLPLPQSEMRENDRRDAEIEGLLREARITLEMWKDVAPAVSLCEDIDAALGENK